MAARTDQSAAVLASAVTGKQLPPLDVALAYVEACRGERTEWERRWRTARAETGTAPRRRWPLIAAVGGAVLVLGVAGAVLAVRLADDPPPADPAPRASRFFADHDVFNQRHPHPRLAPDSAQLVQDLLASGEVRLYSGGAGALVYRADADTPVHEVTPRKHVGRWGPDPFAGVDFPWDASWQLPGERQWTVVLTPDGRSVECWRTRVEDGRPSCEWGAVADTRGSSVVEKGQATGSGMSRLAGLITRAEWKAGRIDHALSFGTLRNDGRPVFPAVDSDGSGRGPWSQGQFIWLDPAYDIEADTSLAPYERVIAKALQEYGAFNVKNSGEFGFLSEYGSRPPGSGEGDHPSLSHIKFGKYLRAGTIKPAS
ncbi:PE-PGRS family protein [Streptomyces albus]|nr:PE-PGRS family protein [Streptomyces albus]AYN31634.1 PE-PGRS family protein [Streptomyces albus]